VQQIIFTDPSGPPANKWFATRRNYFTRKLYTLFCKNYTSFTSQYKEFPPGKPASLTILTETKTEKALLWQLKDLSHSLFTAHSPLEQYGANLNWTIQALFHEAIKMQANIEMVQFHSGQLLDQDADPSQAAFINTTSEEIQQQMSTIDGLLSKAKDIMRLMLVEQTGNDMILRLLIEDELGQTLWHQSTLELFSAMFPYQPEMGYIQAGKSYFMSHRLAESLNAYEKSLAINSDLSEPRRQTYLLRAMIRDRDQREN
jgi:hypothetical protein